MSEAAIVEMYATEVASALPPSFFAHEVYMANGYMTCSISFFSDAAPQK